MENRVPDKFFAAAVAIGLLMCITSVYSALPAGCKNDWNNTYVNCSGSAFTLIPTLGDEVISLDLSFNKLSEVTNVPLVNLELLNFSSNSITFIKEKAFQKMDKLIKLDLSYNMLSGANITDETFNGLKNLVNVYLQGNPLKVLPDSTFHVLKHFKLKFVDISFCQIFRIEEDALAEVATLETLYVHGNYLTETDLNFFDGVSWLENMDMSKNPIKRIEHRPLYPLFHLERLYFDGCQLTTIGDRAFEGLDHLTFLSLSNNSLETINGLAFRPLDKLEELVLSGNPIKSIDPTMFAISKWSLRILRLENMPVLETVKRDSFQNLDHLERLSLTNNKKLTGFESASLLIPHGNLKYINLDNNSLTTLSSTLLDWGRVRMVTLLGNPWYCNCRMRWIISLGGPVNKTTPIMCRGPRELRGSDLLELSPSQLSCLNMDAKIGLGLTLAGGLCILTGLSVFFIIRWRRSGRYTMKDILCLACIRGKEERYISVYQNDDIEPFAKITFSEEEESLKSAVDV